jgi:hypothetical protein
MENVAATAPAATHVDMSQLEANSSVINDGTNPLAAIDPVTTSVANEANVSQEISTTLAEPGEAASAAMVITDLSEQLANEGKRLRIRLGQAKQETFDALTMVPSQRSLAQILSGLPLRETEGISQFEDKAYMPVPFLEKYVMPTKHLMSLVDSSMIEETNRIPGGPVSAILYSLFKDIGAREDRTPHELQAIRATLLQAHPSNSIIEEHRIALGQRIRTMETFVSQLRSVAKLPDQRTLFGMTDSEIEDKNKYLDMSH